MARLYGIQRERLLLFEPHFVLLLQIQKGFVEVFVVLLALRGFDKVRSRHLCDFLCDDGSHTLVLQRCMHRIRRMSRMRWLGRIVGVWREVCSRIVAMRIVVCTWRRLLVVVTYISVWVYCVAIVRVIRTIASMCWVQEMLVSAHRTVRVL